MDIPTPDTSPTPTPSPTPADERAALVAELEALGDAPQDGAGAPEAPDAEPGTEPAAEPAAGDSEPDAADSDAKPDEPEAEPEPEPEAAEPEPEADPELAKRLEAIQRAERRSREQIDAARKELEAERQAAERELAPQRAALEQYEAARKRARYDPVGVLASLGLGADDFEAVARQIYAHSTAAQADPKLRDQAARTMRERQAADELRQLRQEQAELREQMEAERSQRELDAYLDTVGRAASDETPLVRALLTNDPSGARGELRRIAEHLYQTSGEVPDPGDVAAELEKTERQRLQRLGIEPPAAGAKAAPKPRTPDAGETKPGKTLTSTMAATPAKPRTEPLTPEQEREDILANWPG